MKPTKVIFALGVTPGSILDVPWSAKKGLEKKDNVQTRIVAIA